jgi:hypothetical protein
MRLSMTPGRKRDPACVTEANVWQAAFEGLIARADGRGYEYRRVFHSVGIQEAGQENAHY